jgi:hypothetical protein
MAALRVAPMRGAAEVRRIAFEHRQSRRQIVPNAHVVFVRLRAVETPSTDNGDGTAIYPPSAF